MGSLYRPKYRSAAGELKESAVIWLKYRDALGIVRRESSGTEKEQEARRLLKRREGAAEEGRVITPRAEKITVAQLAENLKADYKANGRRSADRLEFSLAHLTPYFGARRAMQITSADVTKYRVQRLEAGAAPATINRELAALKRMYSLAVKGEQLQRMPYIEMLRENNARRGFFEREAFEAVRGHLPAYAQRAATFAYLTGWRLKSEILPLQWRQVDFKAGTVRLEPGTTKNRDGRTFPMTPELRAVLEAQRAATDALQRKTGSIIPCVFHRTARGRPLKGFTKAWRAACLAAGVPGRIPHDFRRTAVRNLERAGVPRSTAMAMVGHRTEAIYRRYAIVDEVMLREGAAKLTAYASSVDFAPNDAAMVYSSPRLGK
jgi:integrase